MPRRRDHVQEPARRGMKACRRRSAAQRAPVARPACKPCLVFIPSPPAGAASTCLSFPLQLLPCSHTHRAPCPPTPAPPLPPTPAASRSSRPGRRSWLGSRQRPRCRTQPRCGRLRCRRSPPSAAAAAAAAGALPAVMPASCRRSLMRAARGGAGHWRQFQRPAQRGATGEECSSARKLRQRRVLTDCS